MTKCTQCGAEAQPTTMKKDKWGRVRQTVQLCERCESGETSYDPRNDPRWGQMMAAQGRGY